MLVSGGAGIDGFMAEIVRTEHPNYKALDNPNVWNAVWRDAGGCTNHDAHFEFRLYQQYLDRPNGSSIATGRWRVKLGADEHTSSDKRFLINLTICYMTKFRDVVPAAIRERCLGNFSDEPED